MGKQTNNTPKPKRIKQTLLQKSMLRQLSKGSASALAFTAEAPALCAYLKASLGKSMDEETAGKVNKVLDQIAANTGGDAVNLHELQADVNLLLGILA